MPQIKRTYAFRRTTLDVTPEMDANIAEIISQTKKQCIYTVNNKTDAIKWALEFTAKKMRQPGSVEVIFE